MTVWRALCEQVLSQCHLQPVQVLKPADWPAPETLCWWFVELYVEPVFLLLVFFQDYVGFGRDGILIFSQPPPVNRGQSALDSGINLASIFGKVLLVTVCVPACFPLRHVDARYRDVRLIDLLRLLESALIADTNWCGSWIMAVQHLLVHCAINLQHCLT
jgi:hypothetical protein